MKIANIYPISNQEYYKNEDYVMILAHLVKDHCYKPEMFNKNQYIIMDNGLYEKEQVSTSLMDVINIAEYSGIPVKEIIIPDSANEWLKTINLFKENLETIKEWQHKYKFMFVAQATTTKELVTMFEFIHNYENLNLSIGVSKLSPIDRNSAPARKLYKDSKFPIHMLGLKNSFKEVLPIKHLIRGCDSSQLAYIAKNCKTNGYTVKSNYNDYTTNVLWCKRSQVKGIEIDLRNDICSEKELDKLLKIEKEFKEVYGIL